MVHAVGMLLGLRRLIDWGNCVKQTKKSLCQVPVSDKSLGMLHPAGMLQGLRRLDRLE